MEEPPWCLRLFSCIWLTWSKQGGKPCCVQCSREEVLGSRGWEKQKDVGGKGLKVWERRKGMRRLNNRGLITWSSMQTILTALTGNKTSMDYVICYATTGDNFLIEAKTWLRVLAWLWIHGPSPPAEGLGWAGQREQHLNVPTGGKIETGVCFSRQIRSGWLHTWPFSIVGLSPVWIPSQIPSHR